MHHGEKKETFFPHITGRNTNGTAGESGEGAEKERKKKITLCALKTEAELMGDRGKAISAGHYYVHNGDVVRVGVVCEKVKIAIRLRTRYRVPRCSKKKMKACDRLLQTPPTPPPPTISPEFRRVLRNCFETSSR